MNITIDNILLIGSILLFISIIAGKTSFRFGIPTLLFFLAVGMLAGSAGIGRIHFDNPKYAQFIGVVALNFILFSGGLKNGAFLCRRTAQSDVDPVLCRYYYRLCSDFLRISPEYTRTFPRKVRTTSEQRPAQYPPDTGTLLLPDSANRTNLWFKFKN